jgi:hypothetical protein
MNDTEKMIMEYSDKMLDISESDMDYGDKTGCFMALAQQIINDIKE